MNPLLLEDPSGEVRAYAAELLAKIGDSDTLAKVRSLVPELERLRDEDLAKLVERRAVLLGRGRSQSYANYAIAQQEETIERNFQRIRTAIDRLEEKLDAESGERGLPGGAGIAPEEGAESNGREPPSGGAPSPAGPRVQAVDENRAVAVAFGESRGGSWSPAAVAVVVLVLVLSLLCICMLLRVRRRRRR